MTRLWIYKNNARSHKHQLSTGDWERFFQLAKNAPKPWGSSDYIGPANTKAVYAMAPGDLVLCWQSDRRSAVGLAEVVEEPSDRDALRRIIRLRVVQRFATPVSLDTLRARPALATLAALKAGPVELSTRPVPSRRPTFSRHAE